MEEVKRITLSPNIERVFAYTKPQHKVEVHNLGDGNLYFRRDGVATVNGENCVKIPSGFGMTYSPKATWLSLHVISDTGTEVQIVQVRGELDRYM
ncbi:hypothetical protein DFP93_101255 [Aneurinibacillus soli]|uniref:Uncharacterized protein n=1 Tax=Aneurinibacillus soli TaxID=1500254 RepID=A0A0U5B0R4_9BACL|nr:hypothetical protein DFP93_101255 [Aneurinibacillus soli]BAU28178.1 hypothetical protein CB4_02352 [Aneurinibacillus soli]